MLAYDDAEIVDIVLDGFLIYYYPAPVEGVISIRELNITGVPR